MGSPGSEGFGQPLPINRIRHLPIPPRLSPASGLLPSLLQPPSAQLPGPTSVLKMPRANLVWPCCCSGLSLATITSQPLCPSSWLHRCSSASAGTQTPLEPSRWAHSCSRCLVKGAFLGSLTWPPNLQALPSPTPFSAPPLTLVFLFST